MRDHADVTTAIAALDGAIQTGPSADVPGLVGELERLRALGWARLSAAPPQRNGDGDGDRLLTAKDVSAKTTLSVAWLYRHAGALPFTRRVGRRVLFSAAGLTKWLASRAP